MRIEFPLAFEHIRIGLRQVRAVGQPHRFHIECIGIRIDAYAFELTVDDSGDHTPEFRIIIHIPHIWPYLGSGVTQPHGRNITSIYICIGHSIFILYRMDSCVQSVGVTVGEHPTQTRILKKSTYPFNLRLHSFRPEKPFLRTWTTV